MAKSKPGAAVVTVNGMPTRLPNLFGPNFSRFGLTYQVSSARFPAKPYPEIPIVLRSPAMSHSPLKAVTHTHVRYWKGDRFGLFLAWVSLVPIFISLGGFISHFIFRRELQGMFFALGLLISQFINEIIKKSV